MNQLRLLFFVSNCWCAWCGEWCEPGEKAWYRVYRFDGEFQTDYLHPECYDAALESDIDSAGFQFGEQERGMRIKESFC